MIILMSFGGATVIVLGIDCYSRAGLKEFWAYIWNLNDNLFPLGADTYPITRGIRVEIAAIVIIWLIGIISQVKLWKVVREKRERKAASLAEDQRYLEQEEEIVGRNIEAQAARERVEWEKVYGGRVLINSTASQYSDGSKVDVIEMTDFSDSSAAQAGTDGLMYAEMVDDGKVMVRVAADEVIGPPNHDEGEATSEQDNALRESDTASHDGDRSVSAEDVAKGKQISQTGSVTGRSSRQKHITTAPEVVPLPFKIPTEDDLKSVGDRSSVATFADDEAVATASLPRDSLVKRVSQGSVTLLRSLSQQKKNTSSEHQLENGESSEELVEPVVIPHHDDQSSLAATVDYDSTSDDDAFSSVVGNDERKSIEITAELGQVEKNEEPNRTESEAAAENNGSKADDEVTQEDGKQNVPAESNAGPRQKDDEPSGVGENQAMVEDQEKNKANSEAKAGDAVEAEEENFMPREQESTVAASHAAEVLKPLEPTEKATSLSSATSNLASLTKDRLPESLSKVALSYRTNEWTKHLSHADAPEPEAIYIEPYASEQDAEVPRYVDIEDLQKNSTGDTVSPPTAKRSNSKTTQVSFVQPNHRSSKKKHHISNVVTSAALPPNALSPGGSPKSPPMDASLQPASPTLRRTSTGFAPIVEEQDGSQVTNMPTSEEAMQQDLNERLLNRSSSGVEVSGNTQFNSHQPKRESTVSLVARETKLANFRQSLAHDLRSMTPGVPNNMARETPFAPTSSLIDDMDIQRTVLMEKREAELQRKEMQRREKEWQDRMFDSRMRSGDLLEAHREVIRKMQSSAKDA
ncbi:hypothetical protein TrVFT333_005482 [Trichoderma virens FT-333]|nr:hypothetical protein TrVFT333_005482 [Trichoderma virens FT-333]